MRTTPIACLAAILLSGLTPLQSVEIPETPAPVKEHQWLQQFVGDWGTETEVLAPGQPPLKGTGTESARMLGGFWLVAEGTSQMPGMPSKMTNLLTLGYDPQKLKYTGTWIDSMTSHLWKYVGTVDPTGRILTLETEGPSPVKPGQTCKFRETIEFKSKDHRVFSSSMLGDDGKWTTFLTMNSRRKK